MLRKGETKMNTPRPCDRCAHLYYDAMTDDSVDCYIECKLGCSLGDATCTMFCWDPACSPQNNLSNLTTKELDNLRTTLVQEKQNAEKALAHIQARADDVILEFIRRHREESKR